MKVKPLLVLAVAVASLVLSSVAVADDADIQRLSDEVKQLRQANENLQAQVNKLQNGQKQNWMDKAQSKEVQALIDEAIADANSRTAMANGATAGHDGSHFFLTDAEGNFLMEIAGQLQFRYIYNHRDRGVVADPDDLVDRDLSGFQLRRAKLNFSGYIGSPKLGYDIVLAADRDDNSVGLEVATISYDLSDNLEIVAGRAKLPFLREELTSSKRQLAVDRAVVTEVFTLNYGEGVWFNYVPHDNVKLVGSFNDGSQSGNIGGTNDFQNDMVDFALTGRADVLIRGAWKQMKDFAAWEGEPFGAFVGGAVHYQQGESGVPGTKTPNYFASTIDGSVENNGMNVFAAVMGSHTDNRGVSPDTDDYGFQVEGGWMVVPDQVEPFLRLEYIDMDGGSYNRIATIGVNRYFNKHNAKLTIDLVYCFDNMSSALSNSPFGSSGISSGLGLREDEPGAEGQFAFRSQFQLLF